MKDSIECRAECDCDPVVTRNCVPIRGYTQQCRGESQGGILCDCRLKRDSSPAAVLRTTP